ncbi:YfcC family protein [Novosphingobium rosa]|uniref:YfcC family protein n=1 Tax=Novosphingobium rosa TaxID=76978 RepID=UPI00147242A5|nr:YfcC family protein [Novosphingobium rosa]
MSLLPSGDTQGHPSVSAAPAEPCAGAPSHTARRWSLDPLLMMLAAMAVAIAMTWAIPSGLYQRASDKENAPVVAGSYHPLPKPISAAALIPHDGPKGVAHPVSPLALVTAIPQGLLKTAPIMIMVLMLGGMFGMLRTSGALDAGIRRLLAISGGRPVVLVPLLMLALSAGSTFLGMVTEYLLLIPVIVTLGRDMGRSTMFGFALVTLAAKVGYLASVTNPFALLIAQPIAGVPVFSGLWLRLSIWVLFLGIAMVVVLRTGRGAATPAPLDAARLAPRHLGILLVAGVTLGTMIYGSVALGWKEMELASVLIAAGAIMAAIARMAPARAVEVFVEGMHRMVLAAVLVGLGRSVDLILREGQILDTIIEAVTLHIQGMSPFAVAPILMGVEMLLTLLIPSTSAKAALSIPILVPIAATCGVSAQTTVLAFLLGNGLVNMFAPTSGMLLAYLATARISYSGWFRYLLPLFALFTALSVSALLLAVATGY